MPDNDWAARSAARYEAQMAHARSIYADVLAALHNAEIPAVMNQTGGMCLAIEFPFGPDGYFLLTDREDVLSWDRDEQQGWMCGAYNLRDDYHEPLVAVTNDRKTPSTAVQVAHEAIRQARAMTN